MTARSGFANREPLTRHQWARRSRRGLCMVRTHRASPEIFRFARFTLEELEVVTASWRRLHTEPGAPSPLASALPADLGRRYQ